MKIVRAAIPAFITLAATSAFAADPAVTSLGQGINAYNSRDFTNASAHLSNAAGLVKVADYVAYYRAYSQLLSGNVDGAVATLTAYRANPIDSSPLAGKI